MVDNNSTDKTAEIATSSGIEVIPCPKQGRSCARNAGLMHTLSPFVAFVDSDVTLDKNWLQELLPMLNHPCLAAVQSKVVPFSQDKNFVDEFIYQFKEQFTLGTFVEMESLRTFNPLLDTAACLYQRDALIKVNGFNEELRFLEDMELSFRLNAEGYSLRASLNTSAYKTANRNLYEFLIRTMNDAQDMYNYMAIYSGKKSLKETMSILRSPAKQSHQWPTSAYKLLARTNDLFWKMGFFHSFALNSLKSLPKREVKMKLAKLNLLLRSVSLADSSTKYGLAPTRRFYLSQQTLIIYGLNEKDLIRYKAPEILAFFKDYLDSGSNFEKLHQGAIKRLIEDRVFAQI